MRKDLEHLNLLAIFRDGTSGLTMLLTMFPLAFRCRII